MACHDHCCCVVTETDSLAFQHEVLHAGQASDIAGEVAAALAHAALAFSDMPELSCMYWDKAQLAYKLTGIETRTFGTSSELYPILHNYYPSSAAITHVFFAAATLAMVARALGKDAAEQQFLTEAVELGGKKELDGSQKWYWEVPSWDNAWWEGAIIMAQLGVEGPKIDGYNPAFKHFLSVFADKWTNGLHPIK